LYDKPKIVKFMIDNYRNDIKFNKGWIEEAIRNNSIKSLKLLLDYNYVDINEVYKVAEDLEETKILKFLKEYKK